MTHGDSKKTGHATSHDTVNPWDDHTKAMALREKVYTDEQDSRDGAREEMRFNSDKNGHWDDLATKRFADKPRYQFDLIKPVVDSIAGEIEQMEFGGDVIPADGSATEDVAKTYEQMIRTISNMSDAPDTFQSSARNIVDHGYDAWMIVSDWADVDAFEQDILVRAIPSAIDRVWLVGVATATRHEDIKAGFVDTMLTLDEYKEQFPEGAAQSVSDAKQNDGNTSSTAKDDSVTVSDYYYIKEQPRELYLLSDNRVVFSDEYEVNQSELEASGVTIQRTRKRSIPRCFMRKFDNGGWLTDEQETVFRYIPIVAVYANKSVIDNELRYYGETRKLMDPQRLYDYGRSREISDGALAPVDKIAMTNEQAQGHAHRYKTMNSNNDPIFVYNAIEGQVNPYRIGGPQPNTQLAFTAQSAKDDIKEISMSHQPQQGAGIAGHSGKAYEILTQKSDTASFKHVKALKKAVQTTYEIIVDAIPRVYDTKNRQMRLTNADGTSKFTAINEQLDGGIVNDLSQGHYMFKVTAGPAYASEKAKAFDVMMSLAAIDPTLLEEGRDIFYNSMQAPGMGDIADRVRKVMVEQGRIPEDQLTDKEKEKIIQEMEQAQANPQTDPIGDATTAALNAEANKLNATAQAAQEKVRIDGQNADTKQAQAIAKIEMEREKLAADIQKIQSETLANLRDATGAEAIASPEVARAYNNVADDLAD